MTSESLAGELGTAREPLVRRLPWYPVVLATVFVLNLVAESGNGPHAVVRCLLVTISAAGVLTVLCIGVTRDRHRGAAIGGLIVVMLAGWRQPILLLAVGVLVVVVVLIIPRTRWAGRLTWPALTRILNVASLILLISVVFKLLQVGTLGALPGDVAQGGSLAAGPSSVSADAPPDIYLILLDAFPRGDFVSDVLAGDLSDFEQALGSRGFDVVERSRANYNFTELTLASMLEMRLLDEVEAVRPHLGTEDRDQPLIRHVINRSRALALVREQGYEIASTASGFDGATIRQADVFLDSGELNEFEVGLLRATPIGWLLDRAGVDVVGDQMRSRVRNGFAFLHELAATPSSRPRFALVHIPAPHAPLVFGPDGQRVTAAFEDPFAYADRPADAADRAAFVKTYLGGLAYLERLTVEAVDDLLASAAPGRDPIIVVFSDHGPRTGLAGSAEDQRAEQLANFLAVRAPGRPGLLGEDLTLVNVLPTLFDAYLEGTFSQSANRSFLTRGDRLFELVEVPSEVASPRP